ncbi:MAG: MgtC/SapB family protein [Dehalococcoidales bacterium]|jgi:uncharacterized membrane protein YhiD involved in acid resistance|nr:MgtC/SapB family protein [Dehalococcoidales bacterium]MDP7285752.1 MgtC/SapB family protein [Dehalococcoidales bacterium]
MTHNEREWLHPDRSKVIRSGGEGIVAGLTTAATIWAVASIGLAICVGLYDDVR